MGVSLVLLAESTGVFVSDAVLDRGVLGRRRLADRFYLPP